MRILIAEDNPDHAALLAQILGEYGNCVVAVDGEQAIEEFTNAWLDNAPFDLICLDILMPKKNGLETLAEIRKLEESKGVGGFHGARIVMTTALEDEENLEQALKFGCEGYVFKSGGGRKLIRQLKALGLIKD